MFTLNDVEAAMRELADFWKCRLSVDRKGDKVHYLFSDPANTICTIPADWSNFDSFTMMWKRYVRPIREDDPPKMLVFNSTATDDYLGAELIDDETVMAVRKDKYSIPTTFPPDGPDGVKGIIVLRYLAGIGGWAGFSGGDSLYF